jgi:hypothetical protein
MLYFFFTNFFQFPMRRQFRRVARFSAFFMLSSALFACGGGGSSSPATPAPAPVPAPVPAPPTAEAALLLTSANAEGVTVLGFGFGGIALGVAQLAVDWTAQVDGSATLSFINPCMGGGSATGTLADRDGDQHAGAGDTVSVVLSNCFLKELDDRFDGTMVVTLAAPLAAQQRAGVVSFSGFGVRGSTPRQDVIGALRFDYTAGRLSKLVHVYSDTQPFGVTFSDATKSLTDLVTALDARHESRLDTVRATTAMRLHVASNLLGGSFDVTTATPWSALFSTFPDAGELAFAGAGASKASMRAAPAKAGMFEVLAAGTFVTTVSADGSGLLWTGAPWLPADAGAAQYAIVAASTTAFRPLIEPAPAQIRPNGPLVWVYSRPLDPASVTPASFYFRSGGKMGNTYTNVPARISFEGAMLSFTPATQLEMGARYELINDGTILDAVVRDLNGTVLSSPRFLGEVPQGANASIADSPKLLLGGGASLMLDAGASSANGQPVSATHWRQLSGPALTLTGADTPRAMLTAPAGTGNGIAVIEVQAANGAGEFDRQQVNVIVAADVSSALLVAYRSGTAPLAIVSNIVPGTGGYASVQQGNTILDVMIGGQRLLAGMAGSQTWQTGQRLAYGPGSTSGVVGPVWLGCGPVDTNSGTLAILDIALDQAGNLARLALDFDDSCSSTGTVTQGSIRYHSALPLRQ